jgi:hypothetical protein
VPYSGPEAPPEKNLSRSSIPASVRSLMIGGFVNQPIHPVLYNKSNSCLRVSNSQRTSDHREVPDKCGSGVNSELFSDLFAGDVGTRPSTFHLCLCPPAKSSRWYWRCAR